MYTYSGNASTIEGSLTTINEKRTRASTSSSWSAWLPQTGHGTVRNIGKTDVSWHGVKIPDYEAKKRLGQLMPLTSYRKETYYWNVPEQSFFGSSSLIEARSNGHLVRHLAYPNIPDFQALDDLDLSSLSTRLMLNAADSAYANGHDTFTFFAELGKTFALFASLGPRIESVFDQLESIASRGAVVSKNGKRVQTTSKQAIVMALLNTPGLWLEARYGLRPLLYDVEEIAKSAAELQHGFLGSIKTAKAADTYVVDPSSFEQTVASYGSVKATTVSTLECGLVANIAARIRSQGFGGSPVITAYELLPLSFVLDWFLDLGSWLGAIHFAVLQNEYEAAMGYRLFETQTTTYDRLTTTSGWSVSGGLGQTVESNELLLRVPGRVPVLPAFSVNLNDMKNLDLGAILYSIFAGKAKLFKKLTG